ncbi:MAG: response regulator [Nitrospirae bacterium]|uniref:response regulator n=1 Tax=Candidatus Magnetobacterium casense TaxID=1455061 RepID=UPI000590C263|nr:response regulator [Candidatus Magnetobacterium casensis]MBF0336914.1 response regulator [Nitrospirota bacterium]
MADSRQIEVLLVEDDPADIDLMREGLLGAKVYVNLRVVMDGVEAMAFLRKEGAYGAALQPDLILLDLNLPKKDGREVLREIKSDEGLKKIPVIILTTSDAETDILRSYNLGANSYVTKPVGFEEFVKVVNTIEDFWFTVVKLPPK